MGRGKYTIILEEDDDGSIIAEVAGLAGCHSWGETKSQALTNIREALELYLEVEKDAKPLKFLGIEKLTLPT
jgi:predicted RNase H-like HicB family nuclease